MNNSLYYLHNIFRVSCAMCFIGHGAFGIITKQVWCNYFAVFGINETTAYQLMPWIGTVDITLGAIFLFYPVRSIALWMIGWAFLTALLRPLSGEPIAEFFERTGNFGAPFLLLLTTGSFNNNLFKRIELDSTVDEKQISCIILVLRIAGFMLLAAHGWLNMTEKQALLSQYEFLGFADPRFVSHIIGALEILCAFVILSKPFREIAIVIVIWKMISEMFFPSHGLFEWIERGASYGILLAVWLTAGHFRQIRSTGLA